MKQKQEKPPEHLVELFGDELSDTLFKSHQQKAKLEGLLSDLPEPKQWDSFSVHDLVAIAASSDKDAELKEIINAAFIYIKKSAQLQTDLDSFVLSYAGSFKVEEAKKKISRWNERVHLWKLWGEKLLRWSMGALAAVILYSFVVCLSDKYDFVKVPVHHTMTEVVKNPLSD